MDMNAEKMAEMKAQYAHMSEAEKEKLRKEKEKEIEDLLDFEKRKKEGKESTYEEMSMDDFMNHPIFMDPNHIPTQEEIDQSDILSSLQAMKYCDLDSPDEQAEEFKKDGTFHFKHKLYKKAIIAYSKAIAVKPTDKKLLASCYNNRGASEYFLKNYRKAIKDSGMAVSIDQNYLKSWIRIFDSCEKLKLWSEGLEMVNIAFDKVKDRDAETSAKLVERRQKFSKKSKEQQREERKRARQKASKLKAEIELVKKIQQSGVKLIIDNEEIDEFDEKDEDSRESLINGIETLQPNVKVHLNDEGVLNWPVMFVYPEYGQTDFIQEFAEDVTLGTMLTEMFQERPPWDEENKYKPERMTLWIEHRKIQSIFEVDINAPLHAALRMKNCYISGGCPNFIVTIRDSAFEKSFKRKYHKAV